MKTCFSEGKLMKQFGNPPFLKEPPLSANPPISEQFFHDPLFVQILKTRTPPPPDQNRTKGGPQKMNFEYFQIQTWMLQTVRVEK